jgi:hypothetical protein
LALGLGYLAALPGRCLETVATLTGASGTSGSAEFTAGTTSGQNSLGVRVSGLTASTTYTVQVDGTTVGQVTTNANGKGHVSLSNLSGTIAAGSVVTVLDPTSTTVLTGTLAAESEHPSRQELSATLSGASGTSGFAAYSANTTTGDNTFRLRVSGLTASTTYTVQVGGTTVGQVTTDASGKGSVSLSNLTATVAAGSVVTVLDPTGVTVLTGTLATRSGHHCD